MQVKARNDATIFSIRRFLGLMENPDGDTTLKAGELSEMRNFKITQEQHLQKRPGSKSVISLRTAANAAGASIPADDETARICGVWRGYAGEQEHTVAAYAGYLFDVDVETSSARVIGQCTEAETSFFGFGGKVYLLNGTDYMSWDGGEDTQFQNVAPYVPLIQTATTPSGSGTTLENVNRLTNERRVQFSPDGTAVTFQLPEKDVNAVTAVTLGGAEQSGWTLSAADGRVTLAAAPAAGTNTLEIRYTKGEATDSEVKGMRYAELYNGSTDTRVFLYGDGTNRAIYSGIEYASGAPSAAYFPAMSELTVGEANTPITALVRHYSRLMAFKPNSAWVIQYSQMSLDGGSTTAAFYVQPVNRQIGNEAPGQVLLVENDPLTLESADVFIWKSTSRSGYITTSENNAKRVSDPVARTLRGVESRTIRTANLAYEHEYWLLLGDGRALIFNYGNNCWYYYDHLPFERVTEIENEVYGFSGDGRVVHFSRLYRNDDGLAIDCYAATGAMDFSKDWLLKYSPMIFVSMQPESAARIYVTVETNRRSEYPEKVVAYNLATFLHVDFNHFSFRTNRKPQVKRVKIKVKKATFYRLIFKSNSASVTATVIETDIKLRYAGYVK